MSWIGPMHAIYFETVELGVLARIANTFIINQRFPDYLSHLRGRATSKVRSLLLHKEIASV
jgi:hypothetical protein